MFGELLCCCCPRHINQNGGAAVADAMVDSSWHNIFNKNFKCHNFLGLCHCHNVVT